MPVERATTAYTQERLNCSQSVLRAFQECRQISEAEITAAQRHGGGRAENGICGALHAALRLADAPAVRAQLQDGFVTHAGATTCREIRRAGRLPCLECVRLAARLLVEQGSAGAEPGLPPAACL